jgi:hypothetical protein
VVRASIKIPGGGANPARFSVGVAVRAPLHSHEVVMSTGLYRPLSLAVLTALLAWPAAAAEPDDRAMQEKLAPFIKCVNQGDNALRQQFGFYREMADKVKDKLNRGTRSNSSTDKLDDIIRFDGFVSSDSQHKQMLRVCADGIEAGVKNAPKIDDLDRFGTDYVTALRQFAPISVEADVYYRMKDYNDDNWTKGREFDDKL